MGCVNLAYIYTHTHTHTYIYVHIYVYIYTHIYMHTYIYVYICVHIYVCAYIHIYIFTHIHIFIDFFYWPHHVAYGILAPQFPDQGSNRCPLQWKHRVFTIGQPGKSLAYFLNLSWLLLPHLHNESDTYFTGFL